MKIDLTIIIPAFNEEKGIEETMNNLLPLCLQREWKIIVVNDGSTDTTGEMLTRFGDKITVITHPYNKGYGSSLKTGIRNASTPLVAFYDADGQHQPEDLAVLVDNMGINDMIVGQRGKDSHQDWLRKPGKWVLKRVANFLTERKIPDLNSGLRIIKREIILSMIHLFPGGFSFSTTSTIAFMNMGYSVSYYPIKVRQRKGKSSVRQLKHGSSTILLILRLIVLFNPLKVFIPASIILFVSGIIYEAVFGIIAVKRLTLIPGALLLILSGVLIFFFGLVVDQISELRKHLETNGK